MVNENIFVCYFITFFSSFDADQYIVNCENRTKIKKVQSINHPTYIAT